MLISHVNPNDVKHFESKLDTKIGYWSPSTNSIDWCEHNYVITQYIAEFWNCISSFLLCILAGISIIRGLYNRIENRFIFFSLSFGLIGFGSACFHGTLTHFGQMIDELSMVYSMIVWWFILFRMNKYKLKNKRSLTDILFISGILYGLLWTYVHRLKTFVLLFQVHFVLMVLGGIIKLIYLYRETQHRTYSIKYLLMAYLSLLVPTSVCWILDQQLCEQMNSNDGFNPQLHAWWHVFVAIDFHLSAVRAEAVTMLLVEKFSSTGIWSTDYCRKIFVDTTLRRHNTLSTQYFVDAALCRRKHVEVEELSRVLNLFEFQTIQLLNLGGEGEGDNYKTTSDKVRVKAKILKLDHTK